MQYTKIAAILCTSAGLALAIAPSAISAAGPQSRTAPSDPLRFPAREISAAYPLDEEDESDSRALDLADEEAEDTAAVAQPSVAPQTERRKPVSGFRAATPPAASVTERDLEPRMDALRERIRRTLAYYQGKRLNTRDHNPWEVMHSIVAYGVQSDLSRNGPDGPPVNAISWLCWNGDCHQVRILEVAGGRVAARKGPKVQGHPGQFLAILAQSRVATSAPIKVGNDRFTLADLIESEKLDCQTGTELTFKLISFSYYLDIDARWKNAAGQDWSISRLVHEELSAPIVGAACGGTHRLMGLAYAVRKREQSGLPMTGEFARAKKYLDDYHNYTLSKLQVGSSRVDLQACKLEYSIVSPK